MRRGRPRHDDVLTPREWEVLDLIREGLTNEQIAARLGVSENTAKYHVAQILAKLDVGTRREAAAWQPVPQVQPRRSRAWALSFPAGLLGKLKAGTAVKLAAAGAIGTAGVAFALLAFGLISMSARSESQPAGSLPDESLGKLAYVQDGDIWSKVLPDGESVRLTDDGRSFAPMWSPSGEWLLLQKRTVDDGEPEYWLMRSDGSDTQRLSPTGEDYAWSPVADTLAFVEEGSLIVEDVSAGTRVELLLPPEEGLLRVVHFAWSPDGAWIAYSVQERAVEGEPWPWDHVALWRVRPDGSRAMELANAGEEPTVGLVPFGFTPEVRGVLYGVNPLMSASALSDGVELRWVGMDGGQSFPIHAPDAGGQPLRVFPQHRDYYDYARDGSLAAVITGSGRGTWQDKHLAIIAPSGPSPFIQFGFLPGEGSADVSPSIAPDVSSIVFASSPDLGSDFAGAMPPELNERRIWLVSRSMAPGEREQLTDDPAFRDERPQWSADGRYILFARLAVDGPDGIGSLWLLNVDPRELTQVQDSLALPTGAVVARGHIPWEQVFDWWQP